MSFSKPTLLTVNGDVSFIDCVADFLLDKGAEGVWFDDGHDPMALARWTVFLPTQRSCKALKEALLARVGGRGLLLPRLRALGDVDEAGLEGEEPLLGEGATIGENVALPLPVSFGSLERYLILTRLIWEWRSKEGKKVAVSPAHGAYLADDLCQLMDTLEREKIDFDALFSLVPEDYAEHWEITDAFLRSAWSCWQAILTEREKVSVIARRNILLERECERLIRGQGKYPVIAAGSTGSVPATARLLEVIARLPRGLVVLPGLDMEMDDLSWRAVGSSPSHPQYALWRFLSGLGVERSHVRMLPAGKKRSSVGSKARVRLANEALCPFVNTAPRGAGDFSETDFFSGLTYVETVHPREEALVIALMMREIAEHPTHRVALVTPDRSLSRRVIAELGRWGIQVNDSAGLSLSGTEAGVFGRLTAVFLTGFWSPLDLLSVLKHPLCRASAASEFSPDAVHILEKAVFRGHKPLLSWAHLRGLLERNVSCKEQAEPALSLINWLEIVLADCEDIDPRRKVPLRQLALLHATLLEKLGLPPSGLDAADMSALFVFLSEIKDCDDASFEIFSRDYSSLFEVYLSTQTVRRPVSKDTQLFIWGPLEVRMMNVDKVIIGGMNEGSWPRRIKADLWLSRSARKQLGLLPPESRIGLSAHDFVQAFGRRDVVITRSTRVDSVQTVPSRWLLRLDRSLRRRGVKEGLQPNGQKWLDWARVLISPPRLGERMTPPRPCPPVEARPRRLSVTAVEKWIKDPYGFYARYILGLKALEPVEAPLNNAFFGQVIHKILSDFISSGKMFENGKQAESGLIALGQELFNTLPDDPVVQGFWWRRFRRIAGWFGEEIFRGQAEILVSHCETKGSLVWGEGAGRFELTARADRIDEMLPQGLRICDYKTGAVPTFLDIERGISPQLPLEAAIARAGGFACIQQVPQEPVEMLYIEVKGRSMKGTDAPCWKRQVEAKEGDDLPARILEELKKRVVEFDNPLRCYEADAGVGISGRSSGEYDHLSRIREWADLPLEHDQDETREQEEFSA